MNEERKIAKAKGHESPIHETIEDTHLCYNTNLKMIIEMLRPQDKLLVGSHNQDSVNLTKQYIISANKHDGRVSIGQLKGFSD